jgi:hypothetical protein
VGNYDSEQDEHGPMTQTTTLGEWHRYGFGGPPEPWEHGARVDLDRLATSYYLDILDAHAHVLADGPDAELWQRVEELFTTATRHKHEIDYTLRHPATPAERAGAADRLGALMRISRQLHAVRAGPDTPGATPEAA